MLRNVIFIVAATVLAACATTPVYAPAARPGGAGFTETQIENNRYFVTYRAGGAIEQTRLYDYALLRAADLTIANQRDWFWVDRESMDATRGRSGPSVGVGIGGGSFGGRGGVGASVGVNFPLGGGGGARATAATLEIRFGEGVKPDAPNAYDAHAVAANLRARLLAPR
jgi:hypothetical protein